ncbi:MlaD family protein [Treponema sp. OttesenSCG-928-L16]|nr:MlaD family protein [Treponema sp. OttesenSCG-928-L16]
MKISRYVKVALFFGSLIVAGSIYIISTSDGFTNLNTKPYEVILHDATGITTNSKVYMSGIPVGKIKSIEREGNHALLHLALNRDIELHSDAQIGRKTSSILGSTMLTLSPGTELTPLISEGGRIGTQPTSGDMADMIIAVQELGGQLTGLLETFQTNQLQLLTASLETFNSIAGKINSQTDAELERISRILESVALITERTDRLLGENEADIGTSFQDIQLALENIRYLTEEIREGKGTIGQIIHDDRLYTSILNTAMGTEQAAGKLNTTLDNINDVVDGAGSLVGKTGGIGAHVDTQARYNMVQEEFRAGASLVVGPKNNESWFRLGVSTVPEGIVSRKTVETTGGANPGIEEVRETKYNIAVDAELARSFGPVTFRGGVLDSSPGLGLDYNPFKWLKVSGEVFNFSSDEKPNLRGSLTVFPFLDPNGGKPWNWLYVHGGVSNALDGGRDFFVGGGVRLGASAGKTKE